MAAKKPARRPAFEFVLDWLDPLAPTTRPFFGAHGVYVGDRIVFILREKGHDADDGVWLATTAGHHASLGRELPSMRDIALFGPGPSGWQNLPSDAPSFERDVTRACELVLAGDGRIGKVPASRRPKAGAKAPAKRRR